MRVAGLIILLLTSLALKAQMPIRVYANEAVAPDSADVARAEKRHFWRAAAEVEGFNVALWAFDRYVAKGEYARISLKTIGHNLTHDFKWDNDKLSTNMFMHPYNGNLFYNAARSNGFNFWQSGLFAIAGSASWELFFENEYPSTNDIIATPIGGMCIGEVAYRASDALLDDRTTGANRAAREISAFIISPMRGFTRLITGDAWKRRSTPGRQFGTPNIALEMSLGAGMLDFHHDDSKVNFGGALKMSLEYGSRFEVKSKKPYDYFTISATLSMMKNQPALQHLEVKGRLIARELLEERDEHLSIGMFQHFDFYDSDTIGRGGVKAHYGKESPVPYKLGVPASVGFGVFYRDIERHQRVFDAYAHLNAVLLGTCVSDHYQLDNRNYNLATGMSTKTGLHMVFGRDKLALSADNQLYLLWTWKGYQPGTNFSTVDERTLNAMGDRSFALFSVTNARFDLKLRHKLYLTLNFEHYLRVTRYKYYPKVASSSLGAQLMLTYKF